MLSKNYTSIRLEVTSHCNLNCEYCHNSEYSNRNDDMSTEELLQLITNLKERYDINKILITGGEPLVNPDICKIVQFITRLGIKADMVTNATLLTQELAIKLEKAGLKRIRISIDDVYKGESLRGNFDPVFLWEKARMVTKCTSIEVCIHTVCTPNNVNKLFDGRYILTDGTVVTADSEYCLKALVKRFQLECNDRISYSQPADSSKLTWTIGYYDVNTDEKFVKFMGDSITYNYGAFR